MRGSDGIRWYQVLVILTYLDIFRHISTMLQIVICHCEAKANEPYFATFWKAPRDWEWLRQISTQFKRLKRFKRAQNAGDSDHHSHLLLRRQNLGLRGVFFSFEIFDQSFPWIGQVAVTESHPPRMMAGPRLGELVPQWLQWAMGQRHGAWGMTVQSQRNSVECWLMLIDVDCFDDFSTKHKLLTFIDKWHYWHWPPFFADVRHSRNALMLRRPCCCVCSATWLNLSKKWTGIVRMMVVKQKHVPFPVHFLHTVQLLTGTSQRVQSPIDGLHTATCASPAMDKMQKLHSGRQDQRLCHACPCRSTCYPTNWGFFNFSYTYLKCGKLWETMSSWFFSVLQLYILFLAWPYKLHGDLM